MKGQRIQKEICCCFEAPESYKSMSIRLFSPASIAESNDVVYASSLPAEFSRIPSLSASLQNIFFLPESKTLTLRIHWPYSEKELIASSTGSVLDRYKFDLSNFSTMQDRPWHLQ
jgi:hypothetical protein